MRSASISRIAGAKPASEVMSMTVFRSRTCVVKRN